MGKRQSRIVTGRALKIIGPRFVRRLEERDISSPFDIIRLMSWQISFRSVRSEGAHAEGVSGCFTAKINRMTH